MFTAVGLSFVLGVLSFFSFVMLMEFIAEGEITVLFGPELLCSILILVMMVFLCSINVGNVLFIIRTSRRRRPLRAAYFIILYPVLFVSYMVATLATIFAPSIAFGLPLFIIGIVFLPYSATVIYREVKAIMVENLVLVECFNCRYVFEMHKEEERMRCPSCGEPNLNPLEGEGGEPLEVVGIDDGDRPIPPD